MHLQPTGPPSPTPFEWPNLESHSYSRRIWNDFRGCLWHKKLNSTGFTFGKLLALLDVVFGFFGAAPRCTIRKAPSTIHPPSQRHHHLEQLLPMLNCLGTFRTKLVQFTWCCNSIHPLCRRRTTTTSTLIEHNLAMQLKSRTHFVIRFKSPPLPRQNCFGNTLFAISGRYCSSTQFPRRRSLHSWSSCASSSVYLAAIALQESFSRSGYGVCSSYLRFFWCGWPLYFM